MSTKSAYANAWVKYLEWLKAQGVNLSLDDLIVDNLKCAYESMATAVRRVHCRGRGILTIYAYLYDGWERIDYKTEPINARER